MPQSISLFYIDFFCLECVDIFYLTSKRDRERELSRLLFTWNKNLNKQMKPQSPNQRHKSFMWFFSSLPLTAFFSAIFKGQTGHFFQH